MVWEASVGLREVVGAAAERTSDSLGKGRRQLEKWTGTDWGRDGDS